MSEQETNSDQRFLDLLIRRQDQHQTFFKNLEEIRWKFLSAFGIAAVIALVSASTAEASDIRIAIAVSLTLIVSLGGLITQVRIFALSVALWKKILILQSEESLIVKRLYEVDERIEIALYSPKTGFTTSNKFQYLLTVHMSTCFIFSSIIGITIAVEFYRLIGYASIAVALAVLITLALAIVAYIASNYYMKDVEGKPEC